HTIAAIFLGDFLFAEGTRSTAENVR
ncbi:MAG: hypothetical protein RL243_1319, partial [Actinomycetota bacterium]